MTVLTSDRARRRDPPGDARELPCAESTEKVTMKKSWLATHSRGEALVVQAATVAPDADGARIALASNSGGGNMIAAARSLQRHRS